MILLRARYKYNNVNNNVRSRMQAWATPNLKTYFHLNTNTYNQLEFKVRASQKPLRQNSACISCFSHSKTSNQLQHLILHYSNIIIIIIIIII